MNTSETGSEVDSSSVKASYQPGDVVADRYRIIRHLGSGGMGSVFEAEHIHIGASRALKVVHKAADDGSPDATRFLRGAKNAALIHHPNVCQVLDFGMLSDGRQYLAMEFVAGLSLGELMRRSGALPAVDAVAIAFYVAQALEAAHRLDVVHRDLKPDNIMLGPEDRGHEGLKVVDFDIARRYTVQAPHAITRPHFAIGTPEYMSPEQAMGQEVSGTTDLYSLGLILYQAITGDLPFRSKNVAQMMANRLTKPVTPLSERMPSAGIPPGLDSLVASLLAPYAANRPSNSLWVARQLQGFHELMKYGEGSFASGSYPLANPSKVSSSQSFELRSGDPTDSLLTSTLDGWVGEPSFSRSDSGPVPVGAGPQGLLPFQGTGGKSRSTAVAYLTTSFILVIGLVVLLMGGDKGTVEELGAPDVLLVPVDDVAVESSEEPNGF